MPFLEREGDIIELLSLMKKTNAVISGSTALQFFDRTIFQNADLDLYFEAKHLDCWKAQLIAFGYCLVPEEKKGSQTSVIEDIYGYPTFEEIATLQSFKHKDKNKVIQLMATKASPMRAILDFHSSEYWLNVFFKH